MIHLETGSAFANVDKAAAPDRLVWYLGAVSRLETVAKYKQASFVQLDVQAGHSVLDVGCGTGDDARMLAALAQPGGRAVGIDSSRRMVLEARGRTAKPGETYLPVEIMLGDAHKLPFANEVFDRSRADRTFMHLDDPELGLREMIRVTRRGGRVVVSEPDWDTLLFDTPNHKVGRRIAAVVADSHRNPSIGRHLMGMFAECGLRETAIEPVTLIFTDRRLAESVFFLSTFSNQALNRGIITPTEYEEWEASLDESAAAGQFFCSLTGFIVGGQRP